MTRKTLHITNAYHPTSGGIRTFYRALLTAANNRGRPMRLIVPGPVDEVEDLGRFGRIYYLKAMRSPAFDRRYRLMLPGTYLPPSHGRLVKILEQEQPDLIEICDKYALCYLAALLRKGFVPNVPRPTLVGLSCERMDDNMAAYLHAGPLARCFARAYVRHIYGPPFDYHVANSHYTADELRTCLWDRAPDFIHVSPMGVDADRFGPAYRDLLLRRSLLERAGGTSDSVLLFYAGRVSPEKNVGLLLDALARLTRLSGVPATRSVRGGVEVPYGDTPVRDYRLVIAGDGPLAGTLAEDAARRAPGRLLMLGPVEGRELLARYYASADVFVHPNPCEPFGIAPLEAMASGVPVVLPSAGGVLSYATHDNAWLAAPDGESFALQIRCAVERPDNTRVSAARGTALAHRWDHIADRFFTLYDRLDESFRRRAQIPHRQEATA